MQNPQTEDRASQPIGDLTSRIVDSLPARASTPSEQPRNSAITGPASRGNAASSSIGTALFGTGAARPPTVREAVQAQDAELVDRALAALLRPLERSCLAPNLTPEFDLKGWRKTGEIPADMLPDLRRTAVAILRPAGQAIAAQEAGRCLLLTKSRSSDQTDLKLMIAALADELADYPADVLTTAFRRWAKREKWSPSLAEIKAECDRFCRLRRSFAAAVAA